MGIKAPQMERLIMKAKQITKQQVAARWLKLHPTKTADDASISSLRDAWWSLRDEDKTPLIKSGYGKFRQPSSAWLESVENLLQ